MTSVTPAQQNYLRKVTACDDDLVHVSTPKVPGSAREVKDLWDKNAALADEVKRLKKALAEVAENGGLKVEEPAPGEVRYIVSRLSSTHCPGANSPVFKAEDDAVAYAKRLSLKNSDGYAISRTISVIRPLAF